MMREIKFRVWDKRFNRYAIAEDIRLNIATGETHGKYSGGNCNDWILEQYTGLQDKNGKEIYEGDRVKWDKYNREYTVDYENGAFWIDSHNGDLDVHTFSIDVHANHIKIIGNIHEETKHEQ